MKILNIFFVCSIVVEICLAQGTIKEEEMHDYLRCVTYVVWNKVRAYGITNLPDKNINISYNISDGNGYDIKGILYLEDSYVMDIEGLTLDSKFRDKPKTIIGGYRASIDTFIRFNISFYRNFNFVAEDPEKIPDQTTGAVIVQPNDFYFDVMITQDLNKYTVNCTMSSVLQGGINKRSMNFYPQNILTNRLKKAFSTSLSDMFPEVGTSWQRIFESFLNETIEIIPFPTMEYPVERN